MPLMVTEADPRSSAGSLSTFLPCDLWITVRFADNAKRKKNKSAWDKFETKILSMAFMGGPEQTVPRTDIVLRHWSDRQDTMLLGLKIPEAGGDDRSVLMGPVAGPSCPNAKSFRSLWGESTCELRRLDDGSIRESVAISNPWGGAYFVAAVVSHLARVHAAETIAECSPLSFDDDFLPRNSRSDLRQVRSAVDRLSRVLLDNSEPSLPVRRVRGLGAVVHSGYEAKSFATPLTFSANKSKSKSAVATPDGRLKPEAKIAPPLTRAIPLTMDITHKKRLSPDMFALLKTAYLINVKKFLDGRSDVAGTMLRAGKVYVEFSDFLFALDVDPPSSTGQDAEDSSTIMLNNFLQSVGLRHNAWPAAFSLVRRWISAKMLEPVVDEDVAAIFLACVFESAPSWNPRRGEPAPPATVESAALRFFDFLSFHDFNSSPVIIRGDASTTTTPEERAREAAFRAAFSDNRDSMPALAVLLPYGAATAVTKSLSKQDLRRLVNLARQALHSSLSSTPTPLDFSSLSEAITKPCDLDIYDIVIQLKPLQVPSIKDNRRRAEGEEEDEAKKSKVDVSGFPVVDFDPVGRFLEELRITFGHFADFYYGRSAGPVVGVKLRPFVVDQTPVDSSQSNHLKNCTGRFVSNGRLVANVEAMVEDFTVLGSGIVREVVCNITS